MKTLFPVIIALCLLAGVGCVKQLPDPQVPIVEPVQDVQDVEDDSNVRLTAPKDGDVVTSPLLIQGSARVFEAVVSYEIRSLNETVLATGFTMTHAQDVGLYGPFEAEIFLPAISEPAFYLDVFWHSPEDGRRLDVVRRRLTLANQEKTTVDVYFSDDAEVIAGDCTAVDVEKRTVAKTLRVGEFAILEMLKGPTKAWGVSMIPEWTTYDSLTIANGEAVLRLNSPSLQEWSGGSCKVQAIRSQIEETLKQFESVNTVRILVNGEEESILQP